MLTVGYKVMLNGYTFTLNRYSIDVSIGANVFAIIPVLDDNGLRSVRTQEQFETAITFWLHDWESNGRLATM